MGVFIDSLAEQGAGAAGSIIGAGLGMALAGWQDRRQLKQQQKLQELQMQGQRQMIDYQQGKQLDMWKATGPVGQMEQYKAAGLNPGLMYGIGGGGGQSTGNTSANVSGANAQGASGEPIAAMGMMLQMQMQKAQIKVAEAQAENIKANTQKTTGVDTDKTWAEISNLIANTQNTQQLKALNTVKTNIEELELEIKDNTFNDVINRIYQESRYSTQIAEAATRDNRIGNATEQTAINTIRLNYAKMAAEKALIEANTRKTEEEITNILRTAQQRWIELEIQSRNASTQERQATTNAAAQQLSQDLAVPEMIGKSIFGILLGQKLGTGGGTEIKGFRR